MNIKQLEAFRAIMITHSTVRAAELLRMSQPAVSRLLNQLESTLRLTLFDRTSGRLVPTAEAMLLYSEVERTFVSVDKIREMASDIRAANAGTLNIASLPLLALSLIPDTMRLFTQTHPRTRIALSVQMSPKVEEMVAAQQIDFGFAEFPFDTQGFQRPGVEVEEFCRVPHLLAVPRDHRLAGRSVVHARDLEGERFISQTRNTVGRIIVDRMFEAEGVRRELVLESQVVAIVAKFVTQGLGVGLIDPFTAHDFADRNLVAIKFEPVVEVRLGLLSPTHRPMTRIASEFIALIKRTRRAILTGTPV